MDGRNWRAVAESAEAEKTAATKILPLKKRKYHTPIDAEQEEGDDSSDSVEIVVNSNRVEDLSDSDEESSEICECSAESGYLADGEAEELPRIYHLPVVVQKPRMKPHAEEKLENAT